MVAQFGMEQKVYGPLPRIHPTATMGCLGTLHLPKGVRSREVLEEAILQMVRGLQHLPRASPPNNLFVQYLGRPQSEQAPPQNAALTRRALEEWGRPLCENKAVAILEKLQEGRPALPERWRSDVNRYCPGPTATRGARFG